MKHLALIFGGPSGEHDVSLVSAKNVNEALSKAQLKISLLGVTRKGQWKLIEESDLKSTSFKTPLNLDACGLPIKIERRGSDVAIINLENQQTVSTPLDVAFPIIHGPYGEDGRLQKELNEFGLSFVGTDTQACEDSFDKEKSKLIIENIGVPQVPFTVLRENESMDDIPDHLEYPVFVKPANMGSSVGISKATNSTTLQTAIAEARKHDSKVVIETGINAREIECAILTKNEKNCVSGMGEIKPNHEFYSYEAKYIDPNGAELVIPAPISKEIADKIESLAVKCFEALGCRDYSRADFFLDDQNNIFFNEINTHPGFTSISMFPTLWKETGMEYQELIMHMINLALNRSVKR